MTTILDPIFASDSQLFKVSVYDVDGVTALTPTSCACVVYNADTDAVVQASAAGTVGAGYAQYNWAGTATAGNYEAVLSVVISATVTKTEHFRVEVRAKPPEFTTLLTTDIGKVRLELGDRVEGAGVKPDGANLTDEEIQVWIDREGSVMTAAAAACEVLARMWSTVANLSLGPRSESLGDVAKAWQARGKELREQYGGAGAGMGFAIAASRNDGYAANETLPTEYTL